jgi:hypothetical protein
MSGVSIPFSRTVGKMLADISAMRLSDGTFFSARMLKGET